MRPDEIAPFPRVGEFYALLEPLTLMRCDEVFESNWNFTHWSPAERNSSCFIPGVRTRFLWYSRNVWMLPEDAQQHRVGSVYLCKKRERLFFIGPVAIEHRESVKNIVRILADWDVTYDSIGNFDAEKVLLFQEGPPRTEDDDLYETRFDKAAR